MIFCRVFVSGTLSNQEAAFKTAFATVLSESKLMQESDVVKVEYLTLSDLREMDWTDNDLFNWLLGSHIHWIPCHPHQGTESFRWKTDIFYARAKILKYHLGFPTGVQVQCPIWTQNKFAYLKVLPPNAIMPTFKIKFSEGMNMKTTKDYIKR